MRILKNGALLREAAAPGFDVFLTSDRNIEFQQNLKKAELLVVVLVAPTNRLQELLPLIPSILAAFKVSAPNHLISIHK